MQKSERLFMPWLFEAHVFRLLLFAINGSKHKSNKRKRRACANYNRSWFQV